MTRWHTDRPVQPVAPLRPLPPTSAVTLFRSDRAARASFRTARAFYRRRLQDWAEQRTDAGKSPEGEEIGAGRD